LTITSSNSVDLLGEKPNLQITSLKHEVVQSKSTSESGPRMVKRSLPTIKFTLTIVNDGKSDFDGPIFIGIAFGDDISRNHYSQGGSTTHSQHIKADSSIQFSIGVNDIIKSGTHLRFYVWTDIDSLKLHKLPKIEDAINYHDFIYKK
jgi:hypothetical protein